MFYLLNDLTSIKHEAIHFKNYYRPAEQAEEVSHVLHYHPETDSTTNTYPIFWKTIFYYFIILRSIKDEDNTLQGLLHASYTSRINYMVPECVL